MKTKDSKPREAIVVFCMCRSVSINGDCNIQTEDRPVIQHRHQVKSPQPTVYFNY